MRPVRTASSNFVYTGPTPEIADLHCQRVERGHVRSVWYLTPLEREMVAAGANLVLDIFTEPLPPVALGVTAEDGIGEDAREVLDRLESLRPGQSPGQSRPGGDVSPGGVS